jgi:hypothetical protein
LAQELAAVETMRSGIIHEETFGRIKADIADGPILFLPLALVNISLRGKPKA